MIIRHVEDKIYKINVKGSEEEFLKVNQSGNFSRVESLPYSKFEKWKVVNNEIVNDTEAEQEIIIKMYEKAIDNHLNLIARQYRYDSIHTACSYASVENPFQAESQMFVKWRGNVWAHCYQVMNDVKSGARQIPSLEELIAELPTLEN